MSKKKQDKVVVTFADSSSVEQVTGSCTLVNKNILIECGGRQGGKMIDNYLHNSSNFSFKVKDLDYVFLLHAHQDHIMRTPLLHKRNTNAKIFIPSGNRDIMYLSLMNCAMILSGEAESLSRDGKSYEPIYTYEDVDKMFENVYEVDMNIRRELDEKTAFTFISSGHVPFGASLILEVDGKKIYYTSDMGSYMFEKYYTEPIDIYEHGVDLFITEATYADKKRSCKNSNERDKDLQRIASAVEQYDKILIPSFAFDRAQQVATMLYEMYKNDQSFEHEIVLDSKLLNDIADVYKKRFPLFRKVMAWNKISQIDKKSRLALQQNKKKKLIVISASGSLVGGASISWCKSFLSNPNACCIIVGHTFEGTLGRTIKDGKMKTITIGEDTLANKMQVTSLRSMTSHIQYQELVDIILNKVKTPKVVLHHSNNKDKLAFKKELDKMLSDKFMSTKVVCPDSKAKIRL